jgi:hypothetical protein
MNNQIQSNQTQGSQQSTQVQGVLGQGIFTDKEITDDALHSQKQMIYRLWHPTWPSNQPEPEKRVDHDYHDKQQIQLKYTCHGAKGMYPTKNQKLNDVQAATQKFNPDAANDPIRAVPRLQHMQKRMPSGILLSTMNDSL